MRINVDYVKQTKTKLKYNFTFNNIYHNIDFSIDE